MPREAPRNAGGALTLPRRYYTSSAIFAAELERLFLDRWLYVGRADALAGPGAYTLFELSPAPAGPEPIPRESVIVVRGEDGQLHAHYNVCRHRGARLCTAPGQLDGKLRCPYHAWTYALDGRLLGAPHMAAVPGFERADYPLVPVAVHEWQGFVFVNFAAPARPFAEAFAPLIDRLTPWQLPRLVAAGRVTYEIAANWKLAFENYAECKHCPVIHPALNHITPYEHASNDLTEGEILGGPMQIADVADSMSEHGQLCGPALVSGALRRQIYYYTIFPTMALSLHPDYVLTYRLTPLAIDRTRIECEWLFDPSWSEDPASDPDQAVAFWDRVNREDWEVCERAQLGVVSRAYRPGPYAALESMSAAFDQAYLAALALARE